jgi:hypothetical protein
MLTAAHPHSCKGCIVLLFSYSRYDAVMDKLSTLSPTSITVEEIMKRVLHSLIAVATILLLIGCGRSMTERDARQIAEGRYRQVCGEMHYCPSDLSGPTETSVGGAAFAYEWKSRDPHSTLGVLITVDDDGDTNVSFTGSAANRIQ